MKKKKKKKIRMESPGVIDSLKKYKNMVMELERFVNYILKE